MTFRDSGTLDGVRRWDKVAPIMVGRRKPLNLQFWTDAEIRMTRQDFKTM
jgi:hypothetical protein